MYGSPKSVFFSDQSIDLLERDSERLHDLLTWKDHEGIFWKWMESVLEAKLQDDTSSSGEDASSSREADVRLVASSQLQESHRTLQEAIVKYEAIVQHIERLCAEKVRWIICKF